MSKFILEQKPNLIFNFQRQTSLYFQSFKNMGFNFFWPTSVKTSVNSKRIEKEVRCSITRSEEKKKLKKKKKPTKMAK
jgi:hypothetical protein